MKILICGIGAMGAVYAGLFREAGHAVQAIDPWDAHVRAIRTQGLRLSGASGDRTIAGIQATTDWGDVTSCDLAVIATKASGVGAAAQGVAQRLGQDTLVLTIQNGLGAAERIAAHMPTDNVMLGVADGFGASLKSPGQAHHNAMKLIRIGEIGGGASRRSQDLAALWRSAGFQAQAFDNIQQLIWEKFLCNVTFSAPCTVFDESVGALMANPAHWQIALGAMREAHMVAQRLGIPLGFDDPEAYVSAFGAKMPDAHPSMLLDHRRHRRSELDAINGQVPVLGRAHGVATPYNDTLVAVLQQRESQFE